MAIGALWLIYRLFKRIADEQTALLILIFTGVSPMFIFYCHRVLTEIPYTFFSLIAITFIEHYKYFDKKTLNGTLLLAIFFTVVTYLTRLIGLSLVAAILVYLLFERRSNQNLWLSLRNVILLGLVMSIPVLLWGLRNYNAEGMDGFTYINFIIEGMNPLNRMQRFTLFEIILHSIYAYAFYAYPMIVLGIQFMKSTIIAPILSIITLYGFLNCLIKKTRIVEYYVIFFMLILFIWPWSVSAGARFIVPIIPFIFYYFFFGIKELSRLIKGREILRKRLLIATISLLFILNIKESILFAVNKERLHSYSQKQLKDFLETVKWVKENTPENAIFASYVDSPMYFYFGRKTKVIPPLADTHEIMNTINSNKIDYIVIIPVIHEVKYYLQPTLRENLNRFIEIYHKNGNVIYQVKR